MLWTIFLTNTSGLFSLFTCIDLTQIISSTFLCQVQHLPNRHKVTWIPFQMQFMLIYIVPDVTRTENLSLSSNSKIYLNMYITICLTFYWTANPERLKMQQLRYRFLLILGDLWSSRMLFITEHFTLVVSDAADKTSETPPKSHKVNKPL